MKTLTYLCYCAILSIPLKGKSLSFMDATKADFRAVGQLQTNTVPKISYISSSQQLQIESRRTHGIKEIRLYSILGQKVKQWNNIQPDASGLVSLSLANMSKGTYLVSVKTETGNYNKRLIIGK